MARRFGIPLAVLAIVAVSACGSSSKSSTSSSNTTTASPTTAYSYGGGSTTSPPTVAASSSVVLKTALNTKVNQEIIVDGASGKTVYEYKPDGTSTTSKVPAALKTAWPPVTTTSGDKGVSGGLSAAKVSVNADNQVAYNGHLLYTFSGDSGPGTANGQALGGIWYVLSANGTPIT